MGEVEEALKKYQGLVPLVYDIETMALEEARPQDMQSAVYLKREADKVIAEKDKEIASLKACMADMVNTSNMVNDSAMQRERRLKRALWAMGAMLGKMGYLAYWNIRAKLSVMGDTEGVEWALRKQAQWKNVERKCRAMTERFKD